MGRGGRRRSGTAVADLGLAHEGPIRHLDVLDAPLDGPVRQLLGQLAARDLPARATALCLDLAALDLTAGPTSVSARCARRVDAPAPSWPPGCGGRLGGDRRGAGPARRRRPAAAGSAGFVPASAASSSTSSAGSSSPPSSSSSPSTPSAPPGRRRPRPPRDPRRRRRAADEPARLGPSSSAGPSGVRARSASGAAPASTARCGGSGEVRSTEWSWSVMEGLPSSCARSQSVRVGRRRHRERLPAGAVAFDPLMGAHHPMGDVDRVGDVREARSQQLARMPHLMLCCPRPVNPAEQTRRARSVETTSVRRGPRRREPQSGRRHPSPPMDGRSLETSGFQPSFIAAIDILDAPDHA